MQKCFRLRLAVSAKVDGAVGRSSQLGKSPYGAVCLSTPRHLGAANQGAWEVVVRGGFRNELPG